MGSQFDDPSQHDRPVPSELRERIEALAVAMNTAQLTCEEIRLGRDLRVPAARILAALSNPGQGEGLRADGTEDPFESLSKTMAFSVDDWGATRAMAWVWGIVEGWDDESYAVLAAQHGWDEATVARLKRLHAAYAHLIPGAKA